MPKAFIWFLIGIIWLFLSSPLFADIGNPYIIPLGERQAYMANTGTGNPDDTGAVFYNPAGLAYLDHDKVSVTGSVYLIYSLDYSTLARMDNTNIPYKAGGLNTIPGTYVGAFRMGDWHLALSILQPSGLHIDNRADITTPTISGELIQSSTTADLWAGFSAAHKLNSRWSLGLSFYGINHSESTEIATQFSLLSASNTAGGQVSRLSLASYGFLAVLGLMFQPTSEWSLGFRLQTPYVQAYGSADTYSSSQIVSSGTVSSSVENRRSVSSLYRIPADMTLGVSFKPTANLELLLDSSLFTGVHYTNLLANSTLAETADADATFRFNFGMQLKLPNHYKLRGGFYYNPSIFHNLSSSTPKKTSSNFFGITGGLGFGSEHVQSSLGAFYVFSTGQYVTDTGIVGPYSITGYGAILTTAYVF